MLTVRPSINERFSSGNNVAAEEGRDVTLTCNVFGIPQPEITWYRRARASRMSDADEEQCHVVTGMADRLREREIGMGHSAVVETP